MNKSELNKFIDLYNLNGTIESVKIISDGDKAKTSFVSDDKTLAGTVTFSSVTLEKGEYGIFDTAQLKKMIGVLEENIEITVNKISDRPVSWSVSDGSTDSTVLLADLSVIPSAPKVKEIKSYDVEIPMNDEFIERYIKAKNALPDVDTFTLLINKKDKMELVIGHSNINTNRIKLDVAPIQGKDKLEKPISFNANYFKEIVSKSKGLGGITFRVSAAGISNISFGSKEFDATYYLIKKDIES
jgi:hypothetical protein